MSILARALARARESERKREVLLTIKNVCVLVIERARGRESARERLSARARGRD